MSQSQRTVLIIDDSPEDRELYRRYLLRDEEYRYIEPFRQGLVTVRPDIYDGSIDPCHVELLAQLQVRANLVVPILQGSPSQQCCITEITTSELTSPRSI